MKESSSCYYCGYKAIIIYNGVPVCLDHAPKIKEPVAQPVPAVVPEKKINPDDIPDTPRLPDHWWETRGAIFVSLKQSILEQAVSTGIQKLIGPVRKGTVIAFGPYNKSITVVGLKIMSAANLRKFANGEWDFEYFENSIVLQPADTLQYTVGSITQT